MKAIPRPCTVRHLTAQGTPQVIEFEGRAFHLTREIKRSRVRGRWWLGEPGREVWVLVCGPATLEVARFDTTDPVSPQGGWWVLRVQE